MATVADIFATMAWGPAPESAEPATAWLERHGSRFGHFINGQAQAPGDTFDVYNPATGALLAQVTQGTIEDVDAAVRAARAAYADWSSTPGHVRARYLYALARQVQKHSRLFAVLETLDNGKPIRESRDLDIPLVARHFAYHAGWAQIMSDEFPGYGPVGVIGQIIPWNFPLLMLAWKVAPALAAGNTVVLKPAEYTPLTALLFAEIAAEVGLPAGVLNIVTGDGRTGAALVEHPDVDKIAFTGSTEVGRLIRKTTAGTRKRMAMELGGKSPFVVFDDADLDAAVEGVVDAIWFNQGQVCCAGSRLLVQESIEERFLSKLRTRMEKLRVGDPLDKAIDIGAIVAPAQLERITGLVEAGRADGADVWQPSTACPTDGWFYPPTLVTGVGPASDLAQVEIFGPVLVAMSFRTPAEAVALANNTRYGLAASVWTQDIDQALDVARGIQAGTIWINSTNLFDASSGFGGYRESGYGREGGREGLYEYIGRVATHPIRGDVQNGGAGQIAFGASSAGQIRTLDVGAVGSRGAKGSNGADGPHPLEGSTDAEGSSGARQRRFDTDARGADAAEEDAPNATGEEGTVENTSSPDGGSVNNAWNASANGDHSARPWTSIPGIDRTPKLFIGGKQARPDSGYSRGVYGPSGRLLGEVGEGNRKDIRNAVEAARAALPGWSAATGYNRSQVLYYLAENLAARAAEFAARLHAQTGQSDAEREVDTALERLFTFAAYADKFEGRVHTPPIRGAALAVPEPIGVMGIACPTCQPLLGFVTLVAASVSLGNTVVAIPSEAHPLTATDLYSVLETSDVPAGVINIVTGERDPLARVLAEHDDVDSVWYVGGSDGRRMVQAASIGNMKRTWGQAESSFARGDFSAEEALRRASQIKNIWIPWGA